MRGQGVPGRPAPGLLANLLGVRLGDHRGTVRGEGRHEAGGHGRDHDGEAGRRQRPAAAQLSQRDHRAGGGRDEAGRRGRVRAGGLPRHLLPRR